MGHRLKIAGLDPRVFNCVKEVPIEYPIKSKLPGVWEFLRRYFASSPRPYPDLIGFFPMHASPIAAVLFALLYAASLHAAPIDDARALLRAGQPEQALQQLDSHTAAHPEDTQARFLKGVILTEQGNTEGAIQVFRALTREYPELPEPYNNLAVLYAGRGDYRAARDALDMAVRVKPDYATAYENLGDIHVLLASQAYEKALSLDGTNRSARGKLSLARELAAYAPPAPKAVP